MKSLRSLFALGLIAAVTMLGSLAAQRLAQGNQQELQTAADKLAQTPEQFGDWELQADHEMAANEQQILQCAGSLHRVYKNRTTGQTINMFIIVGPPGPTSVHNPEICYSSQGFEAAQAAERIVVPGDQKTKSEFWQVTLKSAGATPQHLRVAYAWNAGAGWVAPDQPRLAFGGQPKLFKMQMATTFVQGTSDVDGFERFLGDFLPVLDASLFASQAN